MVQDEVLPLKRNKLIRPDVAQFGDAIPWAAYDAPTKDVGI